MIWRHRALSLTLRDTLQGKDQANPVVRPGDIISVPDADQIYVVGNVTQPRAIPLKEPITVSRAIAMAGGEQRDTKRDGVSITDPQHYANGHIVGDPLHGAPTRHL